MLQQVGNISSKMCFCSVLSCSNVSGETIPMSVAVGDRVLMPEWGSNKLEMDGQEFHVIRETDIVAKLAD